MYRLRHGGFPGGLSFGGAPGDVGAGAGAAAHPDQRDGVDGAVAFDAGVRFKV
jgi:hypothetical protein